MKMLYRISIITLLILSACGVKNEKPQLKGEYLGQKTPGTTPEVFAPGIVSTGMDERDLAFSPDGKEIYFCVRYQTKRAILWVRELDGVWTEPEVVSFSGEYDDVEPFVHPDNNELFFVSNRPIEEGEENESRFNMWRVKRINGGWSNPEYVGAPIGGAGSVFYPTFTKTGVMYFTRAIGVNEYVFRSNYVNGKFSEPEKLPDIVNARPNQYNTLISPNEDFLIIPSLDPNKNGEYYKATFRDKNDNWSELIDLGPEINNGQGGWTPSLSHDGKYFFFMRFIPKHTREVHKNKTKVNYADIVKMHNAPNNSSSDIYWVDAEVIHKLNPFKK